MTDEDLVQAFATYFAEIDQCLAAKCYWALLHMLVVLPAICAATETPSGDTDGNGYMNWCRRYFDRDDRFTPRDRYAMRNVLLHQGRTTVDAERSQYQSYTFVPPTGEDVHLTVREFAPGHKNLTVDVARLADDTKRAMDAWFRDRANARRAHVGANLSLLARQGRAELPTATGLIFQVAVATSTGGVAPR